MSEQPYGFIPWEGYETPPEMMVGETVFDAEGEAVGWIVNPETCQADETETLHARGDTWGTKEFDKKVIVHVMECSECGHTYEHVNGSYEFCPRCGRRIAEVTE